MTTNTDTLENITTNALAIVDREFESDPVPDAIRERCRALQGKPITKRDAAALMTEFPGLRVHIKSDKTWGTKIDWYVDSSSGYWLEGNDNPHTWVEHGPAVKAQRERLIAAGCPKDYNAVRSIQITGYMQNSGVTRWPNPAELEDKNRWAYGARDERNASRQKARSYIANGGDLKQIAALVEQLNMLAGELRGFVVGAPGEVRQAVKDALASTANTLGLD